MFSRFYATIFYAFCVFSIFAAAIPWDTTTATTATTTTTVTVTETAPSGGATEPASSCSTGSLQCCESVQSADDPSVTSLLGLLGVVVQGVDVLVGLTCSPITVIGAGGGSCSANAVCCQDNSFGSLISIGCLPVIL